MLWRITTCNEKTSRNTRSRGQPLRQCPRKTCEMQTCSHMVTDWIGAILPDSRHRWFKPPRQPSSASSQRHSWHSWPRRPCRLHEPRPELDAMCCGRHQLSGLPHAKINPTLVWRMTMGRAVFRLSTNRPMRKAWISPTRWSLVSMPGLYGPSKWHCFAKPAPNQ